MNFRLTMVLVIVMVLIASLYVWMGMPKKAQEKTDLTPKNALVTPAPKTLESISYLRNGAVQVAFAKQGPKGADKWTMTDPVKAGVEIWQIDSIADALKGLEYKEKFDPEPSGIKSEEATGVQSPKNVVEYVDDAGKKHILALGKRTVGGIYARLDGGKTIYLLETNPLDQLDKDPSEFRTKVMAEVNPDKLTEITLATAGQTVELSKQPGADGKWVITRPIAARANKTVIDDILNELKQVKASDFTSMTSDMPAVGLHNPVVTVTAYAEATVPATAPATGPATTPAKKTEAMETLRIGYYTDPVQKKALYAAVENGQDAAEANQVFTISADAFGHLDKDLKDLRDPAITPLTLTEATELSIEPAAPLKNINLEIMDVKKQADQWQIVSLKRPVPAGSLEVADALQTIQDLRAIKFVDNVGDLKSIRLDPPAYKIAIQVPLQSQREVILIGKPETADKVTPVMRQGEPTVYLVQTADVEKVLATTVLALRDKTIEQLAGDTIREIKMAGAAAKAQTLRREGTQWKIDAGGKSIDADEVKVVSLLANFTPVTADKWVGIDMNLPTASPDATITLGIAEPARPETAPATGPATGPASMPARLNGGTMGPANAQRVTRTLKLWKHTAGNVTTWSAIYEGGPEPVWEFEPTAALIEAVTKGDYAAVPAATQAATPAAGVK